MSLQSLHNEQFHEKILLILKALDSGNTRLYQSLYLILHLFSYSDSPTTLLSLELFVIVGGDGMDINGDGGNSGKFSELNGCMP